MAIDFTRYRRSRSPGYPATQNRARADRAAAAPPTAPASPSCAGEIWGKLQQRVNLEATMWNAAEIIARARHRAALGALHQLKG